jgi:putative transposase
MSRTARFEGQRASFPQPVGRREPLSAAEADLLAFHRRPPWEIWRQVWSSNPQERLKQGTVPPHRRRRDLPRLRRHHPAGRRSLNRTTKWAEARRYIGPDILAKVSGLYPPEESSTQE